MKRHLHFLLILLPLALLGQNGEVELRAKAYAALDQKNNYDSAIYYAKLLLDVSTTDLELADHAILRGKIHFMKNEFGKGILAYKKAIEYDSMSYLAPYAYIGLAISYKKIGELDQAIQYYRRAQARFEKSGEDGQVAQTEKLIATLYKDLGEFEKAMKIYSDLLNFFSEKSADRASLLNNLGALYYEQEDYLAALHFHKKAAAIADELGIKSTAGLYFHNLGDVYIQLGRYDSAQQFLLDALQIHQERGSKRDVAKVNLLLSQLYLKMKQRENILALLTDAENIAKEVGERTLLIEVYHAWIEYFEDIEQFEKANSYYPLFIAARDTLLNEEKVRAVNDLEIKYETEKKEEALNASLAREEVQRQSLSLQQNTILWLTSISFLLVVVGSLIFRLYRVSKKEKQQVILRMREQHHRIENNISVLASILSLAAKNTPNEEAKALAKEGENRLNAMNLLHKKLYWDDKHIAIQFGEYVQNLCEYLSGIFSSPGTGKIPVSTRLDNLNLDVSQAIPLSLILNELLTNAFKYGTSVGHPVISVSLTNGNGCIKLMVSDNGPGMEKSVSSEPSFGINLVATLVKQLRGEFVTESNGAGTSVSVMVPTK